MATQRILLILFSVFWTVSAQVLTPSPIDPFDLLHYSSEVTASSTCKSDGDGYTCLSNPCLSRSNTPSLTKILDTNCITTVPSPTSKAVTANGQLYLEGSKSENCTVSKSLSTGGSYSLSFWIRQNCGTCDLFRIAPTGVGETSLLQITNDRLSVQFGSSSAIDIDLIQKNVWKHIVLVKRGSQSEVHVDDSVTGKNKITKDFPTGTINVEVTTKLTDETDTLGYIDFRYYDVPLTVREISQISGDGFPKLGVEGSDCRCPNDYSSVTAYDNMDKYGLYCDDPVQSAGGSRRLNTESHLAVFALDNNASTSWISGQGETGAWLLLILTETYQIDAVSIKFRDTTPAYVVLRFISADDKENDVYNVQGTSGQVFVNWTAEGQIQKRTDFVKRLAKSINITMSGHLDNKTYYEIEDIQLVARVNCFGVSSVVSDKSCTCPSVSNTEGNNCERCQAGKYHDIDDFNCDKTCSCSTVGSVNSSRCGVGGQCTCKPLVGGVKCDQCKPLNFNFSASNPTVCESCNCDSDGTVSCDNSTGACTCKPNFKQGTCAECQEKYYKSSADTCQSCDCNVNGRIEHNETCDASGQCFCRANVQGKKCDQCKQNFYGLQFSKSVGCTPCDCNLVGSNNETCDVVSGQCPCRGDIHQNLQCDASFDSSVLVPNYGPLSGGTLVSVTGKLFGTDMTKVRVFSENTANTPVEFTIDSLSDNMLKFVTKPSQVTEEVNVALQWKKVRGNDADFNKKFKFTFMKDVIVTGVSSPITSFRSGGCSLTISGKNFDSMYQPRLMADIGGGVFSEPCKKMTDSLVCLTPDLSSSSVSSVQYGLERVTNYTNLNDLFPNKAVINLVAPPTVASDDQDLEVNFPFSKTLAIKGKGFKTACRKEDFEVKIGDELCPITSIADDLITCEPEQTFPGRNIEGDVVLKIGYFNITVGRAELNDFWHTKEFIYIAVGAGVFVLLIIVLIVVCCYCCRRRRGSGKHTSSSDHLDIIHASNKKNEYSNLEPTVNPRVANKYTDLTLSQETSDNFHSPIVPAVSNPNPKRQSGASDEEFLEMLDSSLRESVKQSLSSPENVKPGVKCTKKGTETRIINGQFTGGPFQGQQAYMKTTVKDFSHFDKALPRWGINAISECLRFRDLYHDNVLFSCGLLVTNNRFYVMYMSSRRLLKDHLNDSSQEFTTYTLIEMCHQVAEAMGYLSLNGITHKDLAARNCVITEDGMVKVSDSSFAWDLFPEEYMFDPDRERYLPVRWMALESLTSGFYDTTTDVWSFGVFMWEVTSRALILPYPDIINNSDVKDHVVQGYRLGKPDVPEQLYEVMMDCWKRKAASRPSWMNVIETILNVLNPEEQTLYENQDTLQRNGHPPNNVRSNQAFSNPAFQS